MVLTHFESSRPRLYTLKTLRSQLYTEERLYHLFTPYRKKDAHIRPSIEIFPLTMTTYAPKQKQNANDWVLDRFVFYNSFDVKPTLMRFLKEIHFPNVKRFTTRNTLYLPTHLL